MSTQILLTKQGFERLGDEISTLEAKRSVIIQKIDDARKLGDLSENAEYQAAREEQKINDKKLGDLAIVKANAIVITHDMIGDDAVVKIGAKVLLQNTKNNTQKVIVVVSNYESDVENNLISIETPIAQKLIGKSVDDEILIGGQTYAIAKIDYSHL